MKSTKRFFLSFINKLITINFFNVPFKDPSITEISPDMCSMISFFTHIFEELASLLVIFNSSPFSWKLYLSFIFSLNIYFLPFLWLLALSSSTCIKLPLCLKRRVCLLGYPISASNATLPKYHHVPPWSWIFLLLLHWYLTWVFLIYLLICSVYI